MQFFDLKDQYRQIKKEIDAAVIAALEGGVFIGGKAVDDFEKSATQYLGAKYSVSLNSGTDALYLSLKAFDIGPGDEVITSPFTFFATAETIAAAGAKPIFADIDPTTFNVDPAKIEAVITQNTKAIMPVHIFGQMADMVTVKNIAQKHKLKIIEDCAQAIGAVQLINDDYAKAGVIGDIGCFSFFPTKNLGTYGDGGMIVTNDDQIASKIKMLKTHGSSPEDKYKNLIIGVNSRLDTIQAAILEVKIKYLDQWNRARQENAAFYDQNLAGTGDIVAPYIAPGNNHIYHQYTLRTSRRDDLAKFLKSQGIPTMVYYSIPLHLQPALAYLGHKPGDFPEAERATAEVLSLPIYPEMPISEREAVIDSIKKFYAA